MTRRSSLGRLAVVLLALALSGAIGASCSGGSDLSSTDESFELHVRTPTTKEPLSAEAEADLDAAIAAARTSTTTALGGNSTTSIYTPKSTTTTAPSGTTTTTAPPASSTTTTQAVTPEVCTLFSQLLNFYAAIKPQTDPADGAGTAARIAGPVEQSSRGLDQILQQSPSDIKPAATTVVQWLRDAAAGRPFEADGAEGAYQQLQSWFSDHCTAK